MVQATVITGVALIGLTFGPMVWATIAGPAAKHAPAPQETAAKTQPAAPAAPTTPEPATKPTTETRPAAETKAPVSKEALDKLGVNDIKKADPKSNPLEKNNDDILKDLGK